METRNVICVTTPVQRSKGHSAVGGAAYRAGENIKARGQGVDGGDKWFRYSPKAIVVRETFLMTPNGELMDYLSFDHEPDKAETKAARGELWNHVDEMETNKRARLGRDLNLGFAYELDHDEQRALVKEFTQREIVDKGFIADVSIHDYGRTVPAIGTTDEQAATIRGWAQKGTPFLCKEDAQGCSDEHVLEMRNRDGAVTGYKLYQPHAHIRVTPRPVVNGEFAKDKYAGREFNKAETATRWRYEWPKLQNEYLERVGANVRVTSTSADENQFPDIQFSGEGRSNELHSMTQRADAMHDQSRSRHDAAKENREISHEFNDIHNSALHLTASDATASAGDESERDTLRNTTWWRNISEHFDEWRHSVSEKAQEWKARFEAQETRLKNILGWHLDIAEPDPPPSEPEPEQEPDR